MRRVKQSILTFSACAVCAILTQVIDFNSGDSETPDREYFASMAEIERVLAPLSPGSGKDVTDSIDELYRAGLRDEISDSELHKALGREDRVSESPARAVPSAKDVATSIEEIRRNEKNPGLVMSVMGHSLWTGENGTIDQAAAKQFLAAATEDGDAMAAYFLARLLAENNKDRDQWMVLAYYHLAAYLLDMTAVAYGDTGMRISKLCRLEKDRLEFELSTQERVRALELVLEVIRKLKF